MVANFKNMVLSGSRSACGSTNGVRRVARVSAIAAAVMAALPSTAYAAGSAVLEEITVTARRVEERLQDIPASVAAITGDQADRMQSLADIQSLVSGVTFKTIGPVPVIGIRGFGNRSQAGNPSQSAVGIFQDGVYVASTLSTIINRSDTQRVEVAKGPQSTLYGRSSFAGAINIATNDPAEEFSGYLDAGFGGSSVSGDDLWQIRGAVSVPVSDTLSVRFYGLHEERDGFAYDSTSGYRSGGHDRDIGRIRLLWEPSDLVTARLTGSIMRDDMPLSLVSAGVIRAPLGQSVLFANPFNPTIQAEFGDTVWDGNYTVQQEGKIRGEQVTLDLRFDTSIGEFASLTDYQDATLDPVLSLAISDLGFGIGSGTYYEKRWSQEFRLASEIGNFSYLAGLYYLHSEVEQAGGKSVDRSRPFASFGPGSVQFDGVFGPSVSALYQPAYTETDAYAAFVQLGYDITEDLNITVGLRQGRDELTGSTGTFLGATAGFLIPLTPITDQEASFNATTGSVNLSYRLTPDITLYGSYARGNSPGGLNVGDAALVNYDEQGVDAYEMGLKSQLFDSRLQFNVALFNNDYSDLHLTQNRVINGALTAVVTNAGEARGRGIDLDTVAVLSSNWRVGLQYTYVDSEITKYDLPPAQAAQVDLTGVPLVRSPRNSVNASITFTHDIGPGEFQFNAEQSYTSSYTNDYLGEPAGYAYPGIPGVVPAGVTTSQVLELYRTDGYALTNLNFSYSWDDWQVNGNVRNLFDKEYLATTLAFDLVTVPLETPAEPRTFQLSVKYSF